MNQIIKGEIVNKQSVRSAISLFSVFSLFQALLQTMQLRLLQHVKQNQTYSSHWLKVLVNEAVAPEHVGEMGLGIPVVGFG
jgi:hypothetical protein